MTTITLRETTSAKTAAPRHRRDEYLSFTLGTEEYGIDILNVQEIRGFEEPTCIANAPEFILGVLNLRGVIVPIIDMRIQLKLGTAEYNDLTVVIILNVGDRVVGMVVDAVSDVVRLAENQIRPVPQFSCAFDARYITGLATLDHRMLILVDIDRFLAVDTLAHTPPAFIQ